MFDYSNVYIFSELKPEPEIIEVLDKPSKINGGDQIRDENHGNCHDEHTHTIRC